MPRPLLAAASLVVLAALLVGCGKKGVLAPHENQRPVVRFTRAPERTGDLYDYVYDMRWAGFDSDGEVQGFRYCVDPPVPTTATPEPDTAWITTTDFGGTFEFHAAVPQPPAPGDLRRASDYHVFALEAIDERGLASLPVSVAFNAATIVPVARIVTPAPSSRFRQYLPPSFTITWDGSDLDGVASKKPIYYRTKILSGSTPITPTLLANYPDTLLDYYVPRGWATWDSLGPDANSVTLTELPPLQDFVFVVIAFDEAGSYTPYVSGDVNALNFRALYASSGGPVLTVHNDFFSYTYTTGVYSPGDRKTWIELEVPSGIPLPFEWSAKAQDGTYIKAYRWVLDSANLSDDTPRTDENTDTSHWSVANSEETAAVVGPFASAGEHLLYIEAIDGNGLKSLAVVHFTIVSGTFERALAICDDTRFALDRRSPGATTCIDRPLSRFPTAAELDTFLYARGGFPIKCYPAGSVSRPGLFRGYDYDTLNMRPGNSDLTPSLALLSHYRHILWLVNSSAVNNYGSTLVDKITTMTYMNTPGHLNALAAYIRMGGEVWLAGGGSMIASNPFITTSFLPSRPTNYALAPHMFAYDYPHWRSDLRGGSGVFSIQRSRGRLEGSGAYSQFPSAIVPKSLAAGDSLPAWRTNGGDFYVTAIGLEVCDQPNSVTEDFDPTPGGRDMRSTLDTLYSVTGGTLAPGSAVMTVYDGPENPRVIATGFDLWSYNRTNLVQVVDGVLNGIWGMTRSGPPPLPAASRRTGAGIARRPARSSAAPGTR